jgi:hypothetical protein
MDKLMRPQKKFWKFLRKEEIKEGACMSECTCGDSCTCDCGCAEGKECTCGPDCACGCGCAKTETK